QAVEHHSEGATGEKIADAGVLAEAFEDVTDFAFFEIPQREAKNVAIEIDYHLHVEATRGVNQEVIAQRRGRSLKHGDQQHPDEQHVEHRSALVYQDLVDDHLRKDRRSQTKKLQQQRGEEYLKQQCPIRP